MLVNANFAQRAIVAAHDYRWVGSPQVGVERVMLDRVGAEKGRATSVVRYAPGSYFPHHLHPGGEEILVLSGTFSDENEDYPAGWYLRNPPGSSHQPFTKDGAIVFVKLRQMLSGENCHVRIDSRAPSSWQMQEGRAVCPLFSDAVEKVSLQRLSPGETLVQALRGGTELLVLAGALKAEYRSFERGCWIRLPDGDSLSIEAGPQGALLYLKTGHLGGVPDVV